MTWAGLPSLCKNIVYNYTFNYIVYNILNSLVEFMQKNKSIIIDKLFYSCQVKLAPPPLIWFVWIFAKAKIHNLQLLGLKEKHNWPKNMTLSCSCSGIQLSIFKKLRFFVRSYSPPSPDMIKVPFCQSQDSLYSTKDKIWKDNKPKIEV